MGRPKGSKNKPKVQATFETKPAVIPTIDTPSGKKTVQEIKATFNKYDTLKEMFASTKDALQLVDLTKTESRVFQTYSKETLKNYLRNPKSYESQIRNVAKFICRLSYEFKRIILHCASMICGDAFNILPLVDFTQEINEEDLLKNYYETLTKWQRMDFANELLKLLIVAWREDTVYAYVYDDSDQEGGMCFFHILDGDYCRVSSIENGVCRFAFDFSYFKNHQEQLEYYDKEFQSLYNKYDKDSSLRWQELDVKKQICFKVNIDDPTMDYPPFAGLFQRLISLLDLESIQNVKDELSAYKLLVARLKPLTGTDQPDDFEVDIKTAISYYNKFADALPPFIQACISPLPIDVVEFKNLNNTDDEDMISNSTKNLFRSIGGVILDNEKSGSTIYEAQIINDMTIAQSTLLPQVERWLNLYFNYTIGANHAKIKYIQGVSPYTRKEKRKQLLESGQYGLPTKLEIGILDGKTPLETISQSYLEKALNLTELFVPLSSSFVQSGTPDGNSTSTKEVGLTGQGAPEKDTTDLTDSGSKSREQKE